MDFISSVYIKNKSNGNYTLTNLLQIIIKVIQQLRRHVFVNVLRLFQILKLRSFIKRYRVFGDVRLY